MISKTTQIDKCTYIYDSNILLLSLHPLRVKSTKKYKLFQLLNKCPVLHYHTLKLDILRRLALFTSCGISKMIFLGTTTDVVIKLTVWFNNTWLICIKYLVSFSRKNLIGQPGNRICVAPDTLKRPFRPLNHANH